MKSPNWERLRILSAVLEAGSLAGAARKLRVSQPTVSRQVRALEREMGEALIDVTPEGAFPTEAGLRLAPVLDDMERAAAGAQRLLDRDDHMPTARVTCGPWLAAYLSENVGDLLGAPTDLSVEIVSTIAFADLPRREADIAIRNQRPTGGRIALRRLPDYACAVYGARRLVNSRPDAFDSRRFSNFEWAALAPELDHFPTARWLATRLKTKPAVRSGTSVNLLNAAIGGRVLALMPCFIGETEKRLIRVSKPFVPDYGGHWLVVADDIRRRPYVRRAIDRICALLERDKGLLIPKQRAPKSKP